MYSIPVREVEAMNNHVLLAFRKPPNQKNFDVSSSSSFEKLSRNKKWKSFRLIDMIFLPLG